MKEQDENLEQLDGAIDRVHRLAQDIHGELKTQSRLIDDLEQDIDETAEKMNFVSAEMVLFTLGTGHGEAREVIKDEGFLPTLDHRHLSRRPHYPYPRPHLVLTFCSRHYLPLPTG